MATESPFVADAEQIAKSFLVAPLKVERGAPLLYELTVNNNLEVMNPSHVRKPKRGQSAFQTDLCIFEDRTPEVSIPRVVIEFKTRITTHDVITYSAKAVKHKLIYPYLRYGLIASSESWIPGRVFTHNEGLDFFAAVKDQSPESFHTLFKDLISQEVAASKTLEQIAYGDVTTRLFRTEVHIKKFDL